MTIVKARALESSVLGDNRKGGAEYRSGLEGGILEGPCGGTGEPVLRTA